MEKDSDSSSQSFNTCFDQYSKLIYSVAYHILFNPEQAEDVVQETFLRYSLEQEKIENPKFWLIRVATNLCYTLFRKNKSHRNYIERISDGTQTLFTTISSHFARSHQTKNILKDLDETERALIVLKFGHDYEYRELSELLGIPEGTIKSNLFRLMRKLEKKSNDHLGKVSNG